MPERDARTSTDEGVYSNTCHLFLGVDLSTLLIQSLPLFFKTAPGMVVPSLLLLRP
jgi:hypothetical protein